MDDESEFVEANAIETSSWDWLRKVIDDPRIVLAMLFLMTAALGLPLLWMSRAFSVLAKVVWSVVVVIYTIIILWVFWIVMQWCYGRIMDAMQ